jgi:hypothetical protein
MKKLIVFVLAFLALTEIHAQENRKEEAIKNVIDSFFEGLHYGDSSKIRTTIHKDLKIQTTSSTKDGIKVLRTQKAKDFLIAIANKKPENTYFEKLLSYDIKIDGNLASVWTPYEFYLNEKFSHCGANSFQLFDNNGRWEIIYLVDMRRRSDCTALNPEK